MPHQQFPLSPKTGFSLLELSMVLTITAVVAASGFYLGDSMFKSAKVVSTTNRMNIVENALYAYRLANNRLPCPGNLTLTEAANNGVVGKESANPGSCTGGSPAANFSYTVSGKTIVEGSVPVDALQLSHDFLYDGWGRKFSYAVWTNMTRANAFFDYGAQNNCGAIGSCLMGEGTAFARSAIYALISYGPNGHGGFVAGGSRMHTGSTNAEELANCHCDANGGETDYYGLYVMHEATTNPADPLDSFDDIVRFKERWQMQSEEDRYEPAGNLSCSSPAAGEDCVTASSSSSSGGSGSSSGGGDTGFRIDGVTDGDGTGWDMITADVNGDGIEDVIVGATGASPGGQTSAGSTFVVFGTHSGFPNPLPLSSLNGTNGFRLNGSVAQEISGAGITAGDFNGDGIKDIAISGPSCGYDPCPLTQKIYVVYGHTGAWAATMDLTALDGTNGFVLTTTEPSSQDNVVQLGLGGGHPIASGDINGDGIADLVVGAYGADNGGRPTGSGSVFVVFGTVTARPASVDLSTLMDGSKGFRIDNSSLSARAGFSVTVGDINNDTKDDIIIGAPAGSPDGVSHAGSAYVVLGKSGAWATPFALSSLNGSNGFRIDGKEDDWLGYSLKAADVNGDGIQDVIMAAPGLGDSENILSQVYVLFGRTSAWSATMNIASLNGLNGFRIASDFIDDTIRYVSAGDINHDSKADIIMSGSFTPGPIAADGGTVYVVFGKAAGWGADAAVLTYMDGIQGFDLYGGSYPESGDINGDGKDDLLIYGIMTGEMMMGEVPGSVYVYYGQVQPTWPTAVNLSGL